VWAFGQCRQFAFVVFISIAAAFYCKAATAEEEFELVKAFGQLSITCDTTALATFVSIEEPPEILPLNKETCEAIFDRNGKPNIGAILFSIFSQTKADELQALDKTERKDLIEAEFEQMKAALRPVLSLCQDLLHAASDGRAPIIQGGCFFALPRSTHETRALSDRLLRKPEEYTVCAKEPLVAPMRADHPLKEMAGTAPLTWEHFTTGLAKDGFVCDSGQDASCMRFVPMIATGLPNIESGEPNDSSAMLMRQIRVYRGKWSLSRWNEEDCRIGIKPSWCQPDKPPYGDEGGICVQAEDFHIIGHMTLILAP
jgi:hypothetical protein